METQTVIELPTTWIVPDGTLEPLLEKEDPQWHTIMNFVAKALRDAGNDDDVLISYRDQAMSGSFSHLVQVSMVFMGEIELEHDGVPFL